MTARQGGLWCFELIYQSASQPASRSVSHETVFLEVQQLAKSCGRDGSQLKEPVPSHSISLLEEKMIKTLERNVRKLCISTLDFIITLIWEFIKIVVKNVAEYF
jgi:hypothetical protein